MSGFIELLCKKLDYLTCHSFTTKAQCVFLKAIKNYLENGTVLSILDFAENYSFVVQDCSQWPIQEFYWENVQATLHPMTILY